MQKFDYENCLVDMKISKYMQFFGVLFSAGRGFIWGRTACVSIDDVRSGNEVLIAIRFAISC